MMCKTLLRPVLAAILIVLIWRMASSGTVNPLLSDWQHHTIFTGEDSTHGLPNTEFLTATINRKLKHELYYASKEAKGFCARHGFHVYKPQPASSERKIYDLIMVNTELDALEIRLHELYDYVDYFVIVESTKTFQGNAKRLLIREAWERFGRYHKKIIYHQLEVPDNFAPERAWDWEDLQRDAMYDQVVSRLEDGRKPIKGDVIVVADVDEVPRRETMLLLRSCTFPKRLTLASKFYYYSYQFHHVGAEWPFPQATWYDGNATVRPTNLRNGDGGIPLLRDREKATLGNAGWHCSSCFSTMEQFLNKLESFSHGWMNHDYFRNRDRIAAAVRDGVDLWGRETERFTRIEDNQDIPHLVRDQPERFRYMVNRDSPSAGFSDYIM